MRHGVGILGAMQCLVAANILSKYVESFEQVTAWLLFIVGCLNVLIVSACLGLVYHLTADDPLALFTRVCGSKKWLKRND